MKMRGEEDVEKKWLINGSWEVDKVMYHLEWENRDLTHQRDSDYTQALPQTWGKKILSFFVSLFCWSFFLGGWLDSKEYFIMWRTAGNGEIVVMLIFKLSRNMRVRDLVIWLFVESTGLLNNSTKVCNLFITFISTMGYLFVQLVSSWNVEIFIFPVWWGQFVQIERMGIWYGTWSSSSFSTWCRTWIHCGR